jgi:hypothetical protein
VLRCGADARFSLRLARRSARRGPLHHRRDLHGAGGFRKTRARARRSAHSLCAFGSRPCRSGCRDRAGGSFGGHSVGPPVATLRCGSLRRGGRAPWPKALCLRAHVFFGLGRHAASARHAGPGRRIPRSRLHHLLRRARFGDRLGRLSDGGGSAAPGAEIDATRFRVRSSLWPRGRCDRRVGPHELRLPLRQAGGADAARLPGAMAGVSRASRRRGRAVARPLLRALRDRGRDSLKATPQGRGGGAAIPEGRGRAPASRR